MLCRSMWMSYVRDARPGVIILQGYMGCNNPKINVALFASHLSERGHVCHIEPTWIISVSSSLERLKTSHLSIVIHVHSSSPAAKWGPVFKRMQFGSICRHHKTCTVITIELNWSMRRWRSVLYVCIYTWMTFTSWCEWGSAISWIQGVTLRTFHIINMLSYCKISSVKFGIWS